jgi:hypothetical protein
MSTNTSYISNARLFPTKFLLSTFGICNLVSHIISVAGPIVAEIDEPYPFILFVVSVALAIIASLFLKEQNERFVGKKNLKSRGIDEINALSVVEK